MSLNLSKYFTLAIALMCVFLCIAATDLPGYVVKDGKLLRYDKKKQMWVESAIPLPAEIPLAPIPPVPDLPPDTPRPPRPASARPGGPRPAPGRARPRSAAAGFGAGAVRHRAAEEAAMQREEKAARRRTAEARKRAMDKENFDNLVNQIFENKMKIGFEDAVKKYDLDLALSILNEVDLLANQAIVDSAKPKAAATHITSR